MSQRFTVSSINPNDAVGGGGCLCSETKSEDCEPPYVIFHVTETSSNLSPHVVGCRNCIEAAAYALNEDEPLAAGEPSPEPETVEEFVVRTAEPDPAPMTGYAVPVEGEEAPRV